MDFNKTKEYETLLPELTELRRLCEVNYMPMLYAVCVKNEKGKSSFRYQMTGCISLGMTLKNDIFSRFVGVVCGLEVSDNLETNHILIDDSRCQFDRTGRLKQFVLPQIEKIKKLAKDMQIPIFIAICVKNNAEHTEYETCKINADIEFYDDIFTKIEKIIAGYMLTVPIPEDVIDIDLLEEMNIGIDDEDDMEEIDWDSLNAE